MVGGAWLLLSACCRAVCLLPSCLMVAAEAASVSVSVGGPVVVLSLPL